MPIFWIKFVVFMMFLLYKIGMESLAQFIQNKREKAGLSIIGLAQKTNINIEILEDIESGKELFLSVTQRQQLARVLKCSPKDLKALERSYEFNTVTPDIIEDIKNRILKRETNLRCPLCGEPLITRIARMYDLEDNPILCPKAHCVKCTFQIKGDE